MAQSTQEWFGPHGEGTRLKELEQKRAAYLRELAEKDKQHERGQKQAELQAHLERRAALCADTTGSAPSAAVLERWQQEYVDQREAENQAEREAKIRAGSIFD
jgi:hypothetical protein